jgi:23S rRNA (guanosine2251-2'-O)-methyltransferase
MIKESAKFTDGLVFEGMTSISAVINSPSSNDRKITKIIYDASKEKSKYKELAFLRHKSVELGFELLPATSDEINELTIGSSHGGIIAFCEERGIPRLDESSLKNIKNEGFYVMLEGIEDPYNFGYALRSIYASGVDGIILSERNWLSAAGVVCRSSAGASERADIYIADADFIELFKECGYRVVCADIKNSVSIYESNLKKPIFLIVGGEKRGISSSVLSKADEIVRIDYGRSFDAALSATSAATIIAFEVYKQNK